MVIKPRCRADATTANEGLYNVSSATDDVSRVFRVLIVPTK